ncbi:gamma-glutamyltransferase [Salarchaeum japonicum]|uniref:gamma-glutamyltransferase n=1 Tax=Salarchaeum japonicum TaxID=555573 RepID=UPI003C795321
MDFEYPWAFESRRSAVHARNGMVATSHPVAAQAGLAVLQDGGNAADAAVATAAVLNVVEPNMTGIGGDAFALTQFDDEYEALNASGPAPASANLDTYRERTDATDENGDPAMPEDGGLAVTVPGALAGWDALADRYGTRDLDALLEPAVEYARDGVPVSEFVARQFAHAAPRIREYDETADTFLDENGDPYEAGDTLRNPDFADTLERIQNAGIGAFYGGSLGEQVVETVREHGGELALSDLDSYRPEWTDPISTEYRGLEVLEHPPNGQGTVALEALNVASEFDLPSDPTNPDRLHHLIEAVKVAFADGYEYITDPDAYDIPLETMLSEAYAAERAADIGHRASVREAKAGDHADTVYLTVVDGDGNAVSFINSIYMNFGSALTTGGFALQNRGHSFSLDPDHANCLEPGKRPFHTIIPAMLREGGEFRASWGVMGGSMQPQGHLQVVANLRAGLNPQAALDAPRFRWLEDNQVALETNRIPESVVTNLEGRGHRIIEEDAFFDDGGHWGGGQLIWRDDDGTLVGGSDPRKDGQAVGF